MKDIKKADRLISKNVQLLSQSGSIFVPHDVEVDVPFEAFSSLSDNTFAGDLEEAMRRAFYDEFQSDIPIKHEVIVERAALFEDDGTPRTEAVTKDDREHSQWYDRNTLWLSSK